MLVVEEMVAVGGCCRRAGPRMASGKVAARRQSSGSGQFAATLPEVRSEITSIVALAEHIWY